MRFLEKISLIDDEYLDDLKMDIENIINSYINMEQACLEIFDKIKDNLNKKEITEITRSFNPDWYHYNPVPIYSYQDFIDVITEMIKNNDPEYVARDIYNLMGPYNNLGIIDLYKKEEKYWFYMDGGNWDAWMVSEEYFKKELREAIKFQEEEDKIEVFKVLKRIQKRRR